MVLTELQKKALQQIKLFLGTPGSGVFILKGFAGTGKTFLLQTLAAELKKEKSNFTLLAPTGRAAAVLRSKTELDAKTVHSELYNFYDIDGEPDEQKKHPEVDEYGQMRLMFSLRAAEAFEKKIYIVDEASMVSDEPGDPTSFAHFGSGHLLSDLLQVAGTNKIIFSGDPAQLPPVSQPTSPALDQQWLRRQGKPVSAFLLDEVLRQSEGSDVLRLATEVRKLTQHRGFEKWIKLPARGYDAVRLLEPESMKDDYAWYFSKHGIGGCIAICHSNARCTEIVRHVRRIRYGSEDATLHIGDVLMVTQNNYLVPLVNGDFVEVVDIGDQRMHAGIAFRDVRVKAVHNSKEYEILMCEDLLYNGLANLTNDQQRTLMIAFSRKMRGKGIKPKSEAYYLAMQKDPFLNSLRANFGYAVTCHKAQGGEWDKVFLFLHKSMYVMDPASLTRWWYTAVTRAKSSLELADGWWIK